MAAADRKCDHDRSQHSGPAAIRLRISCSRGRSDGPSPVQRCGASSTDSGRAAARSVILRSHLLATLPFTFTFQLIADRRLAAMEAVKVSAKATFRNFWGVLWFFVVNMFVTTVLTLFCFLPALFFSASLDGCVLSSVPSHLPKSGCDQ